MKIAACTIVARNYLPAARVLAKSFLQHHPGASFTTLVVDDLEGGVDEQREPFLVLRLDDIDIEHDETLRMAAIYDVMELCTAVKPWLLQRLLLDADIAIYLDPDIKVFAPLEDVIAAGTEEGIVLTPHVTRPMPRDGLIMSETQVLGSGMYNLGFIAVSRRAGEFLSFWCERLSRDCIVDPGNMRFVDQRWVDFVPGIWPTHILRDPSYNVAYWNLDHRELVYREGGYFVEGVPLHFFHFSGYSPDVPYLLSKHQDPRPRILLSEHPGVALLCEEYGADLRANGYGQASKSKYAFGRLANGLELDRFMRRLYRQELLAAERTGTDRPQNPLVASVADSFADWLTEPAEGSAGSRLSRYLEALHHGRLDLQVAFPDPEGRNFEAFASWAVHEVQQGRLDPRLAKLPLPPASKQVRSRLAFHLTRVERRLSAVPVPGTGNERVRLNMADSVRRLEKAVELLPPPAGLQRAKLNTTRALGRLERRLASVPVPGTSNEKVRLNLARWTGRLERHLTVASPATPVRQEAHARTGPPDPLPGMRVAGYLRTESGVGQLGRLAVATAERAGIPTSTYLETTALSRQAHPFEPSGPDRNVNLVCVNADELSNFAARVGRAFFENHYTAGLWAWEIEEFPRMFEPAFDYVDEVWALSSFAKEAISAASSKPVYTFSLPIVAPTPAPGVGKKELDLPDAFLFLFCFDLLSIFERKNPLGLIEAFTQAFVPGEGPVLVIKVVNGHLEPGSLERLKLAASGRADIIVIDRFLDPEVNAALMAACDCYVSLHRSEGFGLTLGEAMALGKPVIATGYSGNLDFMTSDTSYLVPWSASKVPIGCSPYPAGARWAEPDLDVAARLMREVYLDPVGAAEVGRRARDHVLSKHGVDARAPFVAERFKIAQKKLYEPREPVSASAGSSSPVGPSLADMVRRPRDLNAPSRHPRSARLFRRVAWRLLRSHDDHDRSVHVQVAVAVDELSTEFHHFQTNFERAGESLWQASDAVCRDVEGNRRRLDALANREDELEERIVEQAVRSREQTSALETYESRLGDLERPERWGKLDRAVRATDELRAVPFMSDPGLLRTTDDEGRPAIGYRAGSLPIGGYLSFEEIFRGPEEMIRDRFLPYLEIISAHGPVLDVGCGRAELLDLLVGSGIAAMGVDIDGTMVERARAKGHDVVEQDALEYLATQPEGALGTVFSAQVIEHLSVEGVSRLLTEAYRVLRRDGVMILETVNPYSIQAFKAFWTDLTHRHPIYPEALVVYCAEAGFGEATVMFPNGTGDLSKDRWSEGEYAVVARKRA